MRHFAPVLLALSLTPSAQGLFEGLGFALRQPEGVEVTENGDGRAYFVEARRAGVAADRATPLLRVARIPGVAVAPEALLDALARSSAAALEAADLAGDEAVEAQRLILGELRSGRRAVWRRGDAREREVEVYAFAHDGDTIGVSAWVDLADAADTTAALATMLDSLEARPFDPSARRVHRVAGVQLDVPALTPMARTVHQDGELLSVALAGARVEVAILMLDSPDEAAAALSESFVAQEERLEELVVSAGGSVAARRETARGRHGELVRGQRFTLDLGAAGTQEVRCYYVPVGSRAVSVTVTLLPAARAEVMAEVGALLASLEAVDGERTTAAEPTRVRGLGMSWRVPAGLRVGVEHRDDGALLLLTRNQPLRAGESHFWLTLRGGGRELESLLAAELDIAVTRALPGGTRLSAAPYEMPYSVLESRGTAQEVIDREGTRYSIAAVAVRIDGDRAVVLGRMGEAADAADDDSTLFWLFHELGPGLRGTYTEPACGALLTIERQSTLLVADRLGDRERLRVLAPGLDAELLAREVNAPEVGWQAWLGSEAARLARADADRRTARGERLLPPVRSARALGDDPMASATATGWRRPGAGGNDWSGAWVFAHTSGATSIEARWDGGTGAASLEDLLSGLSVDGALAHGDRTLPLGPLSVPVPPGFEPAARGIEGGVALEVAPLGSRDCALWVEVRGEVPGGPSERLAQAADAWAERFEDVTVERRAAQREIAGREVPGLRLTAATELPERAELFAFDGPGGAWLVSWSGLEAALADAEPAFARCAAGLGASDIRVHAAVDTAVLGATESFDSELLSFEHATAAPVVANVPARPELTAEDGSAELAVELMSRPADPTALAFGRMRHVARDFEAQGAVTERYLLRRQLLGSEVVGQVAVVELEGRRFELHVYATTAGSRGVVIEAWIAAGPGDPGRAHLELLLSSLRVSGS